MVLEDVSVTDEGKNYQESENDAMDLDVFNLGPSNIAPQTTVFDDIGVLTEESLFSPPLSGRSMLSVASVLRQTKDIPWLNVGIKVSHSDVSFYADGKLLISAPLPNSIRDGPGVLRIGQRAPGRFAFKGEIADLSFFTSHALDFEGKDLSDLPDDKPEPLTSFAEDVNGSVGPGSIEGSYVFDGTVASYLDVPEDYQPTAENHFQISFRCKAASDCAGYVVAKTDPSGTTRYWAVAIVKSKAGTSIQFYYRPKDSIIGHRLISANIGRYTKGIMDQEFVILGEDKDLQAGRPDEYRSQLRKDMSSIRRVRESMRRHSSFKR